MTNYTTDDNKNSGTEYDQKNIGICGPIQFVSIDPVTDETSIEEQVAEIRGLDGAERYFSQVALVERIVSEVYDDEIPSWVACEVVDEWGEDLLDECLRLARRQREREKQRARNDAHEEWLDETAARDALRHIDPDLKRPKWGRVCVALINHFDRATGKQLAREWSRRGSKWDEGANRYIEDLSKGANGSTNGSNEAGPGTIIRFAESGGWNVTDAAAAGHERRRERENNRAMDRMLNDFPIQADWEDEITSDDEVEQSEVVQ